MLDVMELANRIMIARISRGWRTAQALVDQIDAHVSAHGLKRSITRETMWRTERGARALTLDEAMLLNAVLRPAEGITYFMPEKKVLEESEV